MGHDADEPPVAVRPKPAVETDAPAKRRRRKRRGKRSRWPYAVARDANGHPEGPIPPGESARAAASSNASANTSKATAQAGEGAATTGDGRGNVVGQSRSAKRKAKRKASRAALDAQQANGGSLSNTGSPDRSTLDRSIAAQSTPGGGAHPANPATPHGAADHHHKSSPLTEPRPGVVIPVTEPALAVVLAGIDRNPGQSHPYRVSDRHPNGGNLYAALDLGTNNCRLLVAEPNRSGFHVVDAFSRIVRLGEGMSASGRLSDIAQGRAIEALHICRAKLEGRGVNRARLVATEACRIAENGSDFIARVERETGLSLEVVSRETEARLAVAGCANLIDWDADGVLLFDIGGGSSELVWLDLNQKGRRDDLTRHIRAWTSLPVGVVTLSERHGGVVVDRRVFEEMVDDVDGMLDGLVEGPALSAAITAGPFHMLGTSGTVTTLAGVHLGLRRYDRRRVDGVWLGSGDVGCMIDRLLDMTFDERVANPCIGADRADLVLAGCAILEAIRRRWPCERLRVADRGLREGILTEMMAADGVWQRQSAPYPGASGHGSRSSHER